MQKLLFTGLIAFVLVACQTGQAPQQNQRNQAPFVAFNLSPQQGQAPLKVSFDASGSSDPDGRITNYSWNFGDGATGSGVTTSHSYTQAGNFRVSLTVTDDTGQRANLSKTLSVTGADGNLPPSASFSLNPTQGNAPLTVTVDASGSQDSDGNLSSYNWDFGDGATGSGISTSHTYSQAGQFTITLTVTDNQGASAQDSKTVTVTKAPQAESDFKLIAAGISIPAEKESIETESAEIGLEAVVLASQASGSPTTTGTLSQNASGQVSYDPNPTDRLKLIFANASSMDYFITELDGNFNASSPSAFFSQDHSFSYRVVIPEKADLTISLQKQNGQTQNFLQGQLSHEGTNYLLDLASTGSYQFDASGPEYLTEETITGTITATDFSLTLNEAKQFKLVNSVENSSRSINNSWTIKGESYDLQNGFIRRAFREGEPNEFDFWRVQGTLRRDGVVIGGIIEDSAPAEIRIYLEVNGQRELLESYLITGK